MLASTGTLLQTFLTVTGMSAERIYIHTAVTGAVNVTIILLFAHFADSGRLILRTASVQLAGGALFLFYLPLCFSESAGLRKFILLIAVSVMQSVTTALHTVCDYKLPYYIIKKDEYGRIMAFCGILYSGISFGIGSLISALSLKYDYSLLMGVAFTVAFIFMLTAAVLTLRLRNISGNEETVGITNKTSIRKADTKSVLANPVFYRFIPANLIRGFSSGVTLVIAVIASDTLHYSEQITTLFVSVQAVASLIGCTVFGLISKRVSHKTSVLTGSIIFLLFPLVLIPDSPVLFLIFAGLIIFGRTVIDYAVPSLLLYIVPARIAGPYNAYRMILHSGGSLLASVLAVVVPAEILVILAAVLQLISGICYAKIPASSHV